MRMIYEVKNEIESIEREIEKKKSEMDNFELDPSDYEDQYDEALNEEGDIHIGCIEFTRAHVLSKLDPIAYSCGLTDYIDSLDKEEDEKYKTLEEELEELEDNLNGLQEELEELENEAN